MKKSLIDQVDFKVRAGDGGGGIVSFRREKFVPKGGPDGGDGGNGGSIYLHANPHVTTLLDYAGKVLFEAMRGESGHHRRQHGKDAENLTLEVPVGTVVWERRQENEEWTKLADLDQPGMTALVAQGGVGGRGNDAFKSSLNTTPQYAEPGQPGEKKELRLELKILADIGLVGLPNAGKSTLLSVLTAAHPEIANYPFTTLAPNLGVMDRKVIADIPGLIEDAHKGKGLGVNFLRHIERCRVLVYVISPLDEDLINQSSNLPDSLTSSLVRQFETVRNEVKSYGHEVDIKKRLVVLNKIDLLSDSQIKEIQAAFEKKGEHMVAVSGATTAGIDLLRTILDTFID